MTRCLESTLRDFLSRHLIAKQPVVLAYSGGVDSTALLSLLLRCKEEFSLDLRVAHFDHGWRAESAAEADYLENLVRSMGLSLYRKRCHGVDWSAVSNKEEIARNYRYDFFRSVYRQVNAQALILAHQREDAAETILKRVLEGAGLGALGGMRPVSRQEEMTLWRPLLYVSKEMLHRWNVDLELIPLQDTTNADLHFLRPRLRYKIFPFLEKWFGKSIQRNLLSLADELFAWKDYLHGALQGHIHKRVGGMLGFALLQENLLSLHPVERKELIRLSLEDRRVCIGKNNMRLVETLLQQKKYDKQVGVSRGKLYIDGGCVIWIEDKEEMAWEVYPYEQEPAFSSLIEAFLQGRCLYKAGSEKGRLCLHKDLSKKEKEKFSSFFARNKIPGTLRRFFPYLRGKQDGICFPILEWDGKGISAEEKNNICVIKIKNLRN